MILFRSQSSNVSTVTASELYGGRPSEVRCKMYNQRQNNVSVANDYCGVKVLASNVKKIRKKCRPVTIIAFEYMFKYLPLQHEIFPQRTLWTYFRNNAQMSSMELPKFLL
jgi:hypothetical protein